MSVQEKSVRTDDGKLPHGIGEGRLRCGPSLRRTSEGGHRPAAWGSPTQRSIPGQKLRVKVYVAE